MNQFSISLGKLFGIKTSIHWTFWILVAWIIFRNAQEGQGQAEILWYLLFVFSIFGCVVLHELGHALAARRYGIQTKSITILPIGGVASLESIPEEPKKELVVALAGPMVNVVIAFLLWVFLSASGKLLLDPEAFTAINGSNFLMALFTVNIVLVVFNMIPAFPMDGGRVLRALLGFQMDRVKATEWAVSIGRVFAIIFVFVGFSNNPFLVFIALFIYLAAGAELNQVRTQSILKGYKLKDALIRNYHVIESHLPLSAAVDLLLNVQDQHFLVMENQKVVGTLSKTAIISGLTTVGENTPISNVMNKNIQWLAPDMDISKAYELMQKNQISIAPVQEDNQLIGVFELDNFSEFLLVKSVRKG